MATQLQMVQFEDRLRKALEDVKLILDSEKSMALPQELHHTYEDKFSLVERCSLLSLASHLNGFKSLGLTNEALLEAKEWADGNAEVSLRFRAEERCDFLREETREVEEPSCSSVDISAVGVALGLISKTVTRVTEYIWNFEVRYTLDLCRGLGAESTDRRCLLAAAPRRMELRTGSAQVAPRRTAVPALSEEMNITFLLKHLKFDGDDCFPCFEIPRDCPKTKTPRRNLQVEEMRIYMLRLADFSRVLKGYFTELQRAANAPSIGPQAIFIPVLPFFHTDDHQRQRMEEAQTQTRMCVRLGHDGEHALSGGLALLSADCNRLLEEEMRQLVERRRELSEVFAGRDEVFSLPEATLLLALTQCCDVVARWCDSLEYVETLLRRQLTAAIGHSVTAADVASYMRFHHRKFFALPFQPIAFSHSVRRSPGAGAEGTLSLEERHGAAVPVGCMCCKRWAQKMKFALNASSSVSFTGDLYLQGWLAHQFAGKAASSLSLVARARQFSCFMVLLGRLISHDEFDPTYAVLVQNKDELQIPLELSTIPTPKEFKDAIESLSPEQQQFAKAFRAMQLESTLCGILVVQIKPQLEQLLNLPPEALTKEIKLTQDLLQLFIKYQIPSDLLSFQGALEASNGAAGAELAAVRARVAEMHGMIEAEKQKEIEEKRQVAFGQAMLKPMGWKGQDQTIEQLQQKVNSLKHISKELKMTEVSPVARLLGRALPPAPLGLEDVMRRNIDCAMQRGESLDVLMEKSQDLSASSKQFYKTAKRTSRFFDSSASRFSTAAPAPKPFVSNSQEGRAMGFGPPPDAAPPSSAVSKPAETPSPPSPASPVAPEGAGSAGSTAGAWDVTQVPKELDEHLEKLDQGVRPTIIKPGEVWTKRSQSSLLAAPKTEQMQKEKIKQEREAAFDLLDALTKGGSLPLSHAEMHVVICATQCFDKTVMDTVIEENTNPIQQLEISSLMMASIIHQTPVTALLQPSQLQRLRTAPLWKQLEGLKPDECQTDLVA